MKIFKDYREVLGQIISKERSKFYSGSMTAQGEDIIQNWLGFN